MEPQQVDLGALVARIDELESRHAIRDLVSDYCHGFDKRDFGRFLAIWWEDCIWDIGPPFGRFEGHDGIHAAIYEVLWPAWAETHHLTTNLRITFDDPDNASSICDVDCVGTLNEGPTCQMVGATYSDRIQRRDGVWRILERDVKIHYFNPVPGTELSAPAED
jgi:ketosteroid isomerase-like protein